MGTTFLEIGTDEARASEDFFAAVFGWRWSKIDGGRSVTDDGQFGLHGGDAPMFVPYFRVANVHAVVERVREQGGRMLGEVQRVDGIGAFATCLDPRGVRFGLHRPE